MAFVLCHQIPSGAAAITHGHPTGYLAAAATAVIVEELARHQSLHEALRVADQCLAADPESGETRLALAAAVQLAQKGVASADATSVTWSLLDSTAPNPNKKVTLTILDNLKLAGDALMLGQTANNPTKDGFEPVYDGVVVPYVVKDDYLYRTPDTAGTETLMRFAGLNPGTYNVTVFEGRTSDGNGRFGKVWVDDITGKKAHQLVERGVGYVPQTNYSSDDDAGIAVDPERFGTPKATSSASVDASDLQSVLGVSVLPAGEHGDDGAANADDAAGTDDNA